MARILVIGGFEESFVNSRGALLLVILECGHEEYACAQESSDEVGTVLANLGIIYCAISFD